MIFCSKKNRTKVDVFSKFEQKNLNIFSPAKNYTPGEGLVRCHKCRSYWN